MPSILAGIKLALAVVAAAPAGVAIADGGADPTRPEVAGDTLTVRLAGLRLH
jgi:hypothetical protein